MFICNFKINKKTIFFFVILIAIITSLFLQFSDSFFKEVPDITKENVDIIITKENYMKEIKNIHENMDKVINKKIKMSGFVFRMPDFNENIFVCGRNIIINSEDKIAGTLCYLENNQRFQDDTWVEIYGTLSKGTYNDKQMPIIKIEKINQIETPKDTYVK